MSTFYCLLSNGFALKEFEFDAMDDKTAADMAMRALQSHVDGQATAMSHFHCLISDGSIFRHYKFDAIDHRTAANLALRAYDRGIAGGLPAGEYKIPVCRNTYLDHVYVIAYWKGRKLKAKNVSAVKSHCRLHGGRWNKLRRNGR